MNITFILLIITMIVAAAMLALGKYYYARRPISRNTTKWILGTYWAVLFASLVVLCFIPDKGFLYQEEDLPDPSVHPPFSGGYGTDTDILRAAREKRLDQTDGILLLEKRSFAFPGTELEVMLREGDVDILVIVERKEQNDGRIEAAYYTAKTLCNEIDISDKMKLPEMEFSGNRLRVTNPENKIEIAEFRKDVTVTQFLDPDTYHQKNGLSLAWGRKVLYLQAPPNVQIKAAQLEVQYIGEK